MTLLPPIAREEDLLPALDLLSHGEALVVPASFERPWNLSPEIVWSSELWSTEATLKGRKNELRCVRRKSAVELAGGLFAQSSAACSCG
ncbi:MAG: hypothetical protein ABI183_26380 [Polyangiaceae bacterium]